MVDPSFGLLGPRGIDLAARHEGHEHRQHQECNSEVCLGTDGTQA